MRTRLPAGRPCAGASRTVCDARAHGEAPRGDDEVGEPRDRDPRVADEHLGRAADRLVDAEVDLQAGRQRVPRHGPPGAVHGDPRWRPVLRARGRGAGREGEEHDHGDGGDPHGTMRPPVGDADNRGTTLNFGHHPGKAAGRPGVRLLHGGRLARRHDRRHGAAPGARRGARRPRRGGRPPRRRHRRRSSSLEAPAGLGKTALLDRVAPLAARGGLPRAPRRPRRRSSATSRSASCGRCSRRRCATRRPPSARRLLDGAAAAAGQLLLDGTVPGGDATMLVAHSLLWLCAALAERAPPGARGRRRAVGRPLLAAGRSPTSRGGSRTSRC